MVTLNGKIALVTGASGGIGKAIVNVFTANGVKVIGTATTKNKAKLISNYHSTNVRGIVLNLNNFLSLKKQITEINSIFGAITILVNNAGISRDNLLISMNNNSWSEVIDINLSSVFRLSKVILRSMLKKKLDELLI